MAKQYHAAFLVPLGASMNLGESGWDIVSNKRLSNEILEFLSQKLGFEKLESYLGIDVYRNVSMKANVTRDEQGRIEFIYFQVFSGDVAEITRVLEPSGLLSAAELFVPHTENR